jgi:hypothetical protein
VQINYPNIPLFRLAGAGALAAVVVCTIVGTLRVTLPSHASEGGQFQLAQIPNVSGNCNNFGNNNINCNTFNYGPASRHLGDDDKAQILDRIPKSRKIAIMTQTGDSDAADLSEEIRSFLVNSGYTVDGPNYAMMFGPKGSPRGVSVNLNDDKPSEPVVITVGTR